MSQRIAIITPVFPPYRGGIGTVAEQDAHQLASLGFAVDVFVPGHFAARPEAGFTLRPLHPWFRFGHAAFNPGAGRLMRQYRLVLLHYPFFGAAEFLAGARRRKGAAQLAVYYHMDAMGDGWRRPIFAAYRRFLMPGVLAAADRIVVTSHDYAVNSLAVSSFEKRPQILREMPPAVDTERFRPGPKRPDLLARYGLRSDEKIVLFVGGLDDAHYFKGVPRILEALTVGPLKSVRALIVGSGNRRSEYEALAVKLGLAGRAVFAGGVSPEELPDHYRLGDVFAFPSVDRSEAFGIAALEAQASGVPVVASDLPGVRTVVAAGVTGVMTVPGSSSALADRLASLLADETRRRQYGAAARERAVAHYGLAARLERWRRLADELLGR